MQIYTIVSSFLIFLLNNKQWWKVIVVSDTRAFFSETPLLMNLTGLCDNHYTMHFNIQSGSGFDYSWVGIVWAMPGMLKTLLGDTTGLQYYKSE